MATASIWARIDVDLPTHPDCLDAGEDATNLYIRGILYSRQHLTDGRIPKAALAILTRKPDAGNHAAELVRVGLWEDDGSHWTIRDFLQRNPSREDAKGKREAAAERKRKWQERNANGTRTERVPNAFQSEGGTRTERVSESVQSQSQSQRSNPPCSPPADAGGPPSLFPVPSDAEEQDASGPLAQVQALEAGTTIREASKRGKAKRKAGPSPDAVRVLERMAELSGCRYGKSAALEARLREGVPVEDCLAVVEHLGRDPWWLERRFANADAPFRSDKFPAYLAQAKAQTSLPLSRASPGRPPGVSDEDWERFKIYTEGA